MNQGFYIFPQMVHELISKNAHNVQNIHRKHFDKSLIQINKMVIIFIAVSIGSIETVTYFQCLHFLILPL